MINTAPTNGRNVSRESIGRPLIRLISSLQPAWPNRYQVVIATTPISIAKA